MDNLLIVTTGGTIDKVYFDDKSDFQVGEPQIGRILEELGVAFRFSVIPILRKDSLHIDAADRALVRATIEAQDTRHVLVTHGTDSMVETARVLAAIAGKTIVLTGALNPARFRGSDAEFNIGCAVGAVQSLPPGVYIAMNGRIWDPAKVRKNVDANRFDARIGIHAGPVVAGVVGSRKFAFDIWGDTVNIAARVEQAGEGGKINITGAVYDRVKEHIRCSYRGKIAAKNKGEIDMFFVEGMK